MMDIKIVKDAFVHQGGVLKTEDLRQLGLNSRQVKRLLETSVIRKIKHGFYELSDGMVAEEILISKLFPKAIIFLESALFHYDYTDRIPGAWQIAVDRDSEKKQYNLSFPSIQPFYQDRKYLDIGVSIYKVQDNEIRIFDRDRTICDTLRYEKKLEKEVYTNAVRRYLNDPKKNLRKLFEYAYLFNIERKVQSQIGKWIE